MPLYNPPSAGGSGDVVGPVSSVEKEVALFDGTTGKLLERATGTGIPRVASGVWGTPAELSGDVTTSGSNAATIANNAVTTAKIADANVTKAKIENVAADKLLGRGNGGGAGAPQEITLGTNLSMSGTTLNAASGGGGITVYNRDATNLLIENTTTKTTVYQFSIGAGDLGTTGAIRVTIGGDYLFNSGTNTWTLEIAYGATAMWVDSTVGMGADADRGAWVIQFLIAAQNSASVQKVIGSVGIGNRNAATTGMGDISSNTNLIYSPIAGSAAEDSTGALNLTVSSTFNVANAAVEINRFYAIAELL